MTLSFAAAQGSVQTPGGAPQRPVAACGTTAEDFYFPDQTQHVVGFTRGCWLLYLYCGSLLCIQQQFWARGTCG